MGISFRKIEAKSRLINPLKGFIADEIPLEISNFRLGNCIAFGKKNRKINGLSHFFT